MAGLAKPRVALHRARSLGHGAIRPVRIEVDRLTSRRGRADLALFHQFAPPPTGGGHQFLRALVGELERRGLTVELNRISGRTPACLFNSFNFDFHRLRRFARPDCRLVHRVDGPIGVYRGFDDGTDRRIAEINRDLAQATVVQSRYSLDAHREMRIELREPVVIPNSVDPDIFHPPDLHSPLDGGKLRLVTTSWSDNPNKGADVLAWLDRNLDQKRYALTFVGRSPQPFERIRTLGPLPSTLLADELRRHDVFVAPSVHDPSSNAVLEALACGLPVAFRRSGGHPELVGEGGLGFDRPEDLPEVLERMARELGERRAAIRVPALAEVADRYLEVLRG